jgi:putative zinc finger/helix-turn-helix YgiT family protein
MIGENMNFDETPSETHKETTSCFNCGSLNVKKEWKNQRFQYGSGESAVELNAEMPVYCCEECGFEFAGAEAEDIRHEAVCRHLGLLAPREIVAIRESTGLSRMQFTEISGIGIASLKRWETGTLIQNAANDQLIYLMTFRENVERLKRRDHFASLDLTDLSAESETARRHGHTHHFRARCIQADSHLLQCAKSWPLRA